MQNLKKILRTNLEIKAYIILGHNQDKIVRLTQKRIFQEIAL